MMLKPKYVKLFYSMTLMLLGNPHEDLALLDYIWMDF